MNIGLAIIVFLSHLALLPPTSISYLSSTQQESIFHQGNLRT